MKSKPATSETYNPWPHRWATVLVCVTFPLIWVGGLVTTYDAGMAVPDWPSTYGYNLFLYPWSTWISGPFDLFIEHGHRLLGALAGIVSIALVFSAFWRASNAIRVLAVGALLLVIAQGVLGGARVLLDQRILALLHGCVGPAFFAYCVVVAVVTSRYWPHLSQIDSRFARLTLITTALVYLQIVLGANIRHVTADALPSVFRIGVLFHVGMAIVLLGHAIALSVRGWRQRSTIPAIVRIPATVLAGLVALQIVLGIYVWVLKFGWPFGLNERFRFAATTIVEGSMQQAMMTTAHVALGSLILAISAMCAVRSCRFFRLLAAVEPAAIKRAEWQWEAAS